jgi:hypothetical protein
MERVTAIKGKNITQKDIIKLRNIMNLITSDINSSDDFFYNEQPREIFSDFLNCIWTYNPDFKYKDDLEFLYLKPKTILLEKLTISFDEYILEEGKKLL